MKLTFIIPPVFDGNKQPAERTAGCTRVVYLAPNIYELTVAAVLEAEGKYTVAYEDFVYDKRRPADFEKFVSADDSDIYFIWTVNLSLDSDALATEVIRRHRSGAYIVYLGPGATYFPGKILKNDHDIVVRGEPEQTVKELVAAIASGDGRGIFCGRIYVAPGAQRTQAFQQSNNLLLSENAHIDAKPQLEIYADDVKCSHGATVGQLNEEAVYYMRQRGISEETARRLQIIGFVGQLLGHIPIAAVIEQFETLVTEKIERM